MKTTTNNKKELKKVISDYEMNEHIANHIIDMIEKRDYDQWRKTWATRPATLTNFYYKVIRGELSATVYSKELFNPTLWGFIEISVKPGFYLTFKDIKAHGLSLKKGAKGVSTYKPAKFEKNLTKAQEAKLEELMAEPEAIEDETLARRIAKLIEKPTEAMQIEFDYIEKGVSKHFKEAVYKNRKGQWVYKCFMFVLVYYFNNEDLVNPVNVKELWGVGEESELVKHDNKRIALAEQVKKSYIERAKLTFNEVEQDQAFYRPGDHSVTVPTLAQFEDSSKYYQTLFHEFAHSTGHPSLLNRATLVGNQGFGTKTYSKEELVAELSSTFTLSALDLLTDEIVRNSVSYLASWGSNLKASIRHNIVNTISHSQKATNLILNLN